MTEDTNIITARMLHVTIGGESHDLAITDLDIGDASSDADIKSAVSEHFSIPASKLQAHEIVRHENGNLTIQPPASFGR